MGSTIIKIFSGERASEPSKTALAQILGGGPFLSQGGPFWGSLPPTKIPAGAHDHWISIRLDIFIFMLGMYTHHVKFHLLC